MARVRIEEIVDHLDTEFRKALEDTLKEHFPGQPFDSRLIFRTFKRQVYSKCSVWENVPDQHVEKD